MAEPTVPCLRPPGRSPRPLRAWCHRSLVGLALCVCPSVGQAAYAPPGPASSTISLLQPPPDDFAWAPSGGQGLADGVIFGAPGRRLHPHAGGVLQLHGGALIPHGEFSRHARVGVAYGAGLGGEWRLGACSTVRLLGAYTRAQLTAKEVGLSGPVVLNLIALRADYLLGHSWWRPYLGVGIGLVPWRGKISQPAAQRDNDGRGHPILGTVAAGVELNLAAHLALAPELSWTPVGGSFKASLWGAGLALRARI